MQRDHEEKKTKSSELGSETNFESDLKTAQNTCPSTGRRVYRQTAQHRTLELSLSTAMGVLSTG